MGTKCKIYRTNDDDDDDDDIYIYIYIYIIIIKILGRILLQLSQDPRKNIITIKWVVGEEVFFFNNKVSNDFFW